MLKTDILIAGSGISGLFLAIKTAQQCPELLITMMTKESAANSTTRLAQGGIAVVTDGLARSFEQHIKDTVAAGGGSCDERIVEMVINQAPERLAELIEMGVTFDKTLVGNWHLGLEGGHSQHRILHHKDQSGQEIEQKLLEKVKLLPNVMLLENHLIIDIHTEEMPQGKQATGAFYYDKANSNIKYIRARKIILSTGGCGQVFENTTNPEIATGDGVAIALRAGAKVADMQHIQFHPTALYEENKNPFFLISEAVRGFGAYIVNEHQKRFVFKYDLRGELATRDIVSKAIAAEMGASEKKHVYLDCRHLDAVAFSKHFPAITTYCKNLGLDPQQHLLPIVPVAHYQCGGIAVDGFGQTNIQNLYAIGECARTGLHGKNRLASNSLLEALVFAHQAAANITATIGNCTFSPKFFIAKSQGISGIENAADCHQLKKQLQRTMTSFYNNPDYDTTVAVKNIADIKASAENIIATENITLPLIELSNLIAVASVIIAQGKTAYSKTT